MRMQLVMVLNTTIGSVLVLHLQVHLFPSQAVDAMADAKILLNSYERLPTSLTYSRETHSFVFFSLRPKEQQPSGTCNMSRINTVYLNYYLTTHSMLAAIT